MGPGSDPGPGREDGAVVAVRSPKADIVRRKQESPAAGHLHFTREVSRMPLERHRA